VNKLGGKHGIGRVDWLKPVRRHEVPRVYERPADILHFAHRQIER